MKSRIAIVMLLTILSCGTTGKKRLVVPGYPDLKLGFSTQNFMASMPVNVESTKEIIDFASNQGFCFIELRDPDASLSFTDCQEIANYAHGKNILVLYEIHRNFLDTLYMNVLVKAIKNTTAFGEPGILRVLLSLSEFASDPEKKGWDKEEFNQVLSIAQKSTEMARQQNVTLIAENVIEAFFGKDSAYYGLDDFFSQTTGIGLQFDTSNPFVKNSREPADPKMVEKFLTENADRWVTTHLKSGKDGIFQPMLMENPMPLDRIINLMGEKQVPWIALELASITNKEECYDNHLKSIEYLVSQGLIMVK